MPDNDALNDLMEDASAAMGVVLRRLRRVARDLGLTDLFQQPESPKGDEPAEPKVTVRVPPRPCLTLEQVEGLRQYRRDWVDYYKAVRDRGVAPGHVPNGILAVLDRLGIDIIDDP